MAASLVKRTGEERTYLISFASQPEIEDGDTLASVTGVTSETIDGSGATALTIGTPALSGTTGVSVEISGGSDGNTYRLTCTVVTTNGSTLVSKARLKVSNAFAGIVT